MNPQMFFRFNFPLR